MARKNTLKNHGYIPCTAMKDLAKPSDSRPFPSRTPYQLRINELVKKLCVKGPDGCGKCENLSVCEYGKAWMEREKEMMIRAEITLADGEMIIRYFKFWDDLCAWIERHHEHVQEVNAKDRKADEIRQGRDEKK